MALRDCTRTHIHTCTSLMDVHKMVSTPELSLFTGKTGESSNGCLLEALVEALG